jgi:hypothetical protein
MLAPIGDGQRRRRGSDGVRLAGAVLALVCCVLVIRYDSRIDRAITAVIHPPPRTITWLVTVVYQAGSFGVATVFIQRLFTSYLPPIWGWATLVWMRKREYL